MTISLFVSYNNICNVVEPLAVCANVNHVNDKPGYFTCGCVSSSDQCISSGSCVVEERCPESNGHFRGIHAYEFQKYSSPYIVFSDYSDIHYTLTS